MKHQTIIATPGMSSIKPIICAAPRLKRGAQSVAINAIGINPSTVPGTKSVNRAVRNQSMLDLFVEFSEVCSILGSPCYKSVCTPALDDCCGCAWARKLHIADKFKKSIL